MTVEQTIRALQKYPLETELVRYYFDPSRSGTSYKEGFLPLVQLSLITDQTKQKVQLEFSL